MRAIFGFLATSSIAAGQAAVDLAEVEVLGDPRRPPDRFTWSNGTQPLVSRSPGSRQRRRRVRAARVRGGGR